MELVPGFGLLLQGLSATMTAPTFASLTTLLTGWVFASRRTVTRMILAAGDAAENGVSISNGAQVAGGLPGLGANAAAVKGMKTPASPKEIGPSGFRSPSIDPKIQGQMGPRGWSPQQINEAIQGGRQVPAINRATGNPAIRYVHPTTGQSVVVDKITGEVIHVGGPGFQYGPGAGDVPLLPAPRR
jgi:hypothetical protein